MATLVRSMGLSLQEFYETLETVGVSAATGMGMDLLFEAIDRAAQTCVRACMRGAGAGSVSCLLRFFFFVLFTFCVSSLLSVSGFFLCVFGCLILFCC